MRSLLFGQPRPGLTDIGIEITKSLVKEDWIVVTSYQKNADKWNLLNPKPRVFTTKQLGDQSFPPTQSIILDQVVAANFYHKDWVLRLFQDTDQLFVIDSNPFVHFKNEILQRFQELYLARIGLRKKTEQFHSTFLSNQRTLSVKELCTMGAALGDMTYVRVDARTGQTVTNNLGSNNLSEFREESKKTPIGKDPSKVIVTVSPAADTKHQQVLQPFRELRHLNGLIGDNETLTEALFEEKNKGELEIVFKFHSSKLDMACVLLLGILRRLREQRLILVGQITI
jgi:hypothetical protein